MVFLFFREWYFFVWLNFQVCPQRNGYRFRCQSNLFNSSENQRKFLYYNYLPGTGFEGRKKNKAITNDSMYKHKSYTTRNNLLFVARTPQTWTTCILLFNFAWILYTTLHEATPPHHKTPRFRIFDDIWIVSCHSHSWLVLSSFCIVYTYERYARIRI